MDEPADLLVGEAAGDVPDDGDVALGQVRAGLAVGGVGDHARGDLRVEHRVTAIDGADRPLDLGELDVLDQVALGARVETLEDDVVLAVARQHHHGGTRRGGEHAPAHLRAPEWGGRVRRGVRPRRRNAGAARPASPGGRTSRICAIITPASCFRARRAAWSSDAFVLPLSAMSILSAIENTVCRRVSCRILSTRIRSWATAAWAAFA